MPGDIENPVPGLYMHKRKATFAELEADATFLNGQIGFVYPDEAYVKLNDTIVRLAIDPDNIVYKDGTNAPFTGNIGVVSNEVNFVTGLISSIDAFQVGKGGFLTGSTDNTQTKLSSNIYITDGGPSVVDAAEIAVEITLTPSEGMVVSVWEPGEPVTNPPTSQFIFGVDKTDIAGPIAFCAEVGAGMTAEWLATDAKVYQNRLGPYSNLSTGKNGLLYTLLGTGFRSEAVIGAEAEEYFSAASSSNNLGKAVVYSGGDILGIGSTSSLGSSTVAQHDIINNTTIDIPIVNSTQVSQAALTTRDRSAVILVESKTQAGVAGDFSILRSTNNGASWSIVYVPTGTLVAGGITEHTDGTLVVSAYSVDGKIIPLHSEDGGLTWTLESLVPSNPQTGLPVTYTTNKNIFMKVAGVGYAVATRMTSSNYPYIVTGPTLGGPWTTGAAINNLSKAQYISCAYGKDSELFVACHAEDGTHDAIYKSIDQGATWYEVYASPDTGPATAIVKMVESDTGILYAVVRGTSDFKARIILSLDRGETWDTIEDRTTDIRDIEYVPETDTIYYIRDNSADSKGYIVESAPLARDIYVGPDGFTPSRVRMLSGQTDITVAKQTHDYGDQVEFGLPEVQVTNKGIPLLLDPRNAVDHASAAKGGIYRSTVLNKLFVSSTDGSEATPLGDRMLEMIRASDMIPNSGNTASNPVTRVFTGTESSSAAQAIQYLEAVSGDYHYAQIQCNKFWGGSQKLRARACFTHSSLNSENIQMDFHIRVVNNNETIANIEPMISGEVTPLTGKGTAAPLYTPWTEITFDPKSYEPDRGQALLDIALTRNTGVANNALTTVFILNIEIEFLGV